MVFDRYAGLARSRNIGTISFGADFGYGDTLSCATSRNPLFDTLRVDPDTGRPKQKMVDSALICDLLHLVRTKTSFAYMVIADDDDFIPALFTAEKWGGRVALLQNRVSVNSHLRLDGMVFPLRKS
jgi:hypothetical protein